MIGCFPRLVTRSWAAEETVQTAEEAEQTRKRGIPVGEMIDVGLAPLGRAGHFVVLGDGIAQKDQIDPTALQFLELGLELGQGADHRGELGRLRAPVDAELESFTSTVTGWPRCLIANRPIVARTVFPSSISSKK